MDYYVIVILWALKAIRILSNPWSKQTCHATLKKKKGGSGESHDISLKLEYLSNIFIFKT